MMVERRGTLKEQRLARRTISPSQLTRTQRKRVAFESKQRQIQFEATKKDVQDITSSEEYARKYQQIPDWLKPSFFTPAEVRTKQEETKQVDIQKAREQVTFYQDKVRYYSQKEDDATSESQRAFYRNKLKQMSAKKDVWAREAEALLQQGYSWKSVEDYVRTKAYHAARQEAYEFERSEAQKRAVSKFKEEYIEFGLEPVIKTEKVIGFKEIKTGEVFGFESLVDRPAQLHALAEKGLVTVEERKIPTAPTKPIELFLLGGIPGEIPALVTPEEVQQMQQRIEATIPKQTFFEDIPVSPLAESFKERALELKQLGIEPGEISLKEDKTFLEKLEGTIKYDVQLFKYGTPGQAQEVVEKYVETAAKGAVIAGLHALGPVGTLATTAGMGLGTISGAAIFTGAKIGLDVGLEETYRDIDYDGISKQTIKKALVSPTARDLYAGLITSAGLIGLSKIQIQQVSVSDIPAREIRPGVYEVTGGKAIVKTTRPFLGTETIREVDITGAGVFKQIDKDVLSAQKLEFITKFDSGKVLVSKGETLVLIKPTPTKDVFISRDISRIFKPKDITKLVKEASKFKSPKFFLGKDIIVKKETVTLPSEFGGMVEITPFKSVGVGRRTVYDLIDDIIKGRGVVTYRLGVGTYERPISAVADEGFATLTKNILKTATKDAPVVSVKSIAKQAIDAASKLIKDIDVTPILSLGAGVGVIKEITKIRPIVDVEPSTLIADINKITSAATMSVKDITKEKVKTRQIVSVDVAQKQLQKVITKQKATTKLKAKQVQRTQAAQKLKIAQALRFQQALATKQITKQALKTITLPIVTPIVPPRILAPKIPIIPIIPIPLFGKLKKRKKKKKVRGIAYARVPGFTEKALGLHLAKPKKIKLIDAAKLVRQETTGFEIIDPLKVID